MLSCHCFIEWLTTYSNLVEYDRQLHNDDRDASSFLSFLRGVPKIDLPLFMFSLAKSILIFVFSISTLLARGTKTVILIEVILEEKRPYPKPIQS